jgi:metal-sulfur cluster biosynthetic enzyme
VALPGHPRQPTTDAQAPTTLGRRSDAATPRATAPSCLGASRIYTSGVASKNDVLDALRQVEDPELGMDIVDLGLVYEVEMEGPKAKVIYSLTSMGCPAGPLIAQDIDRTALEVPGVEEVELELVFDPPWTPDRMSDDAKFILGFG